MSNDAIVRPRAFVIMPFGEGFNEIYDLFISGALIEAGYDVYSGETGHSFRFKTATCRSEATLDDHYTSLWPE